MAVTKAEIAGLIPHAGAMCLLDGVVEWDATHICSVSRSHHDMYVVGGLIVGNPDDTRESIETNLEFARAYVDWPYIQHPTPYPRTPMSRDFREQQLIVDEDVSHYDGTTAVVKTKHETSTK